MTIHSTTGFFGSLDIPVYEVFGQSECTGPQTFNMPGKWKIGTCGSALVHTVMKIGEQQEFIYQGRNTMMGYMKDDVRRTVHP